MWAWWSGVVAFTRRRHHIGPGVVEGVVEGEARIPPAWRVGDNVAACDWTQLILMFFLFKFNRFYIIFKYKSVSHVE
ncbi:hypothetical protein Hanom_Chr02g00142751 [Helianthus anomalus]